MNHNSFGYTGESWDEEDDLLYLRNRYYMPEVGRFVTKDTFPGSMSNALSLHRYTYVENNPINFVDPLGLSKKDIKLTDKMKSAGVKIVTRRDGTQLYDFSTAINQMIWRSAVLCKEQRDDYYSGLIGGAKSVLPYDLLNWYKSKVDSGKAWDLKIPGRWKEQLPGLEDFNVKDADNNFNKFVLNGEVITAEDLGNIAYGYWGRATGFGDKLLYVLGGYVAVGKNADDPRLYDSTQYYGDTKRDHYMIKKGIDWYESSFGDDNPPFDPGLTTIWVSLEGLDAKTGLYNEIDDLKTKLPWN